MEFHPSKTHDVLNGQPFDPQLITKSVMLNPLYPAFNIQGAEVVDIDSGAFQELKCRKTPKIALTRQIMLTRKLDLTRVKRLTLFTYDQMKGVDEEIINGRKVKTRGTEESATLAIEATLYAAKFYNANRKFISGSIGFVCQGINPDQYVDQCARPILEIMQPDDVFGFGGFCIIGRVPSLKPLFVETFLRILPMLQERGLKYAHIMGVCVADMITFAASTATRFGITLSTDSSSPEINGAAFGKRFINQKWIPFYEPAQKFRDYHPCDLALQNIKDYHEWVQSLAYNHDCMMLQLDRATSLNYLECAP